jgi:hypothetical protein
MVEGIQPNMSSAHGLLQENSAEIQQDNVRRGRSQEVTCRRSRRGEGLPTAAASVCPVRLPAPTFEP